jgi:DinB family protein
MHDLATRLRDAGAELLDLRGPLVQGEPWPLSAAYGTEPEADWGPRELLAHVNEMLPYWTAQLEGVLAGDPASATPFGRVATDDDRLARIAADRQQSAGWLLDGIDAGLVTATGFVEGLSDADLDRVGLHPARGELTVGASIDRFLVTHLEEHVVQLRGILDRRTG